MLSVFGFYSRYQKFRARVSALALDPAVQGIVYCGIFMFMPLGNALLPLILKESVYLLWVIKEVLQIAAPGEGGKEQSRNFRRRDRMKDASKLIVYPLLPMS